MPNYKRLTPFKRCVLQNFPFIEADFDALTNYGLLSKIVEYLNNVISAQNTVQTNMTALNDAFIQLQNYVNQYFENLDVQEEINNKLDAMAIDGSLGRIINEVVQPTITELESDYDEFTEQINNDINRLTSLIDAAVGQTPPVVDSTSAMTDTSKIYVNTTDGKWYYYNGSAWTIGGDYQAVSIADNSVSKAMTKFRKPSGKNLFDWSSATILKLNLGNNPITANEACSVIYIPVEHYTVYHVSKIQSARFTVALTNVIPAAGVSRVAATTDNDETDIVMRVSNKASYLAVMYHVSTVEDISADTILKSITIVKENQKTYPNSQDYYALSISKDDINSNSVTPSKTTFCRTSNNAYDPENPQILNAFFNRTNTNISANNDMRTVFVPCEANTTYTVIKPSESQRFCVGYTTGNSAPAIGTPVSGITPNDQASSITITTGEDASYIVVFLCNTTIMNFADAVDGLMIYKGAVPDYYVDHKIIDVKTENIRDGAVTKDKLAPSVLGDNYLSSRSKVYGISYDITVNNPAVTRIADAAGLRADYVIGDTYMLNNGVNDFDNVYPWSDIRLCNVRYNENGKKVITYENETGFTRDGSNGEVMVEIPKFYSFRQRIGNIETWAISGEKKAGFEVEPMFKAGGKELDFVYVGAYNGTGENVESISGYMPQVNKTISEFINQYNAKNLNSYDITVFFALQKLMTIEFATRNLQTYFGGITNQSYMMQTTTLNQDGVIKAIDTNSVSVAMNTNQRPLYFFVGQKIKFGQQGQGGYPDFSNSRTITAISYDGETGYVDITYDGEDMSSTLEVDTWGVYGMAQVTGLTDSLNYHTGRTNFATAGTDTAKRNLNNPFKYRNIENVYGNVWERTAGIVVKNLRAYINYEPDQIDLTSGTWITTGIPVPLQTTAGHAASAWIVEESYNRDLPLIALPSKIGASNGGGQDYFFTDSFYSNNQSDVSYYSVTGGAWDHYVFAGAFTIRSYETINSSFWLYGNRPIIRR